MNAPTWRDSFLENLLEYKCDLIQWQLSKTYYPDNAIVALRQIFDWTSKNSRPNQSNLTENLILRMR